MPITNKTISGPFEKEGWDGIFHWWEVAYTAPDGRIFSKVLSWLPNTLRPDRDTIRTQVLRAALTYATTNKQGQNNEPG